MVTSPVEREQAPQISDKMAKQAYGAFWEARRVGERPYDTMRAALAEVYPFIEAEVLDRLRRDGLRWTQYAIQWPGPDGKTYPEGLVCPEVDHRDDLEDAADLARLYPGACRIVEREVAAEPWRVRGAS